MTDKLTLTYDANKLCDAERLAGRPLAAMLAELESDEGASLTTLRALYAAGMINVSYPYLPAGPWHAEMAGRAIDRHGTARCAEAVGKGLAAYFDRGAA